MPHTKALKMPLLAPTVKRVYYPSGEGTQRMSFVISRLRPSTSPSVSHLLRKFQLINNISEDYYKSLFGFKKADGYWTWFAGNIASGAAAGASSSVFVYSLDYARTRLANDAKTSKGGSRQFNGLLDVYKKTLATDGVRGLYRGFVPSIAGIVVYRGLYFGLYDSFSALYFFFSSFQLRMFSQSLLY